MLTKSTKGDGPKRGPKVTQSEKRTSRSGCETDLLWLVLVRPLGSGCWTVEHIAWTEERAVELASVCRARVLRFADGTTHKSSTAIRCVKVPKEPEKVPAHYPSPE